MLEALLGKSSAVQRSHGVDEEMKKSKPWTWKDDAKEVRAILSSLLTQKDFARVTHYLRRIQKHIKELEEPKH